MLAVSSDIGWCWPARRVGSWFWDRMRCWRDRLCGDCEVKRQVGFERFRVLEIVVREPELREATIRARSVTGALKSTGPAPSVGAIVTLPAAQRAPSSAVLRTSVAVFTGVANSVSAAPIRSAVMRAATFVLGPAADSVTTHPQLEPKNFVFARFSSTSASSVGARRSVSAAKSPVQGTRCFSVAIFGTVAAVLAVSRVANTVAARKRRNKSSTVGWASCFLLRRILANGVSAATGEVDVVSADARLLVTPVKGARISVVAGRSSSRLAHTVNVAEFLAIAKDAVVAIGVGRADDSASSQLV